MEIAQNIKKIRELYNLNQTEFAALLGVTREYLNKMENGRLDVKKKVSQKLQKLLEERAQQQSFADVEWLGNPQLQPETVRIPYYEQLRRQKSERSEILVPLIAQKAQAGYAKGYEQTDYMNALEKFALPPGVHGAGALWSYFEVDGDSMEPTFYAGDMVLASMLPYEDWDDIKNFGVYVVLAGDRLVLKRVYRKSRDMWVFISDNEEQYPQQLVPVSSVQQVWTFRRHIRSKAAPPKDFRITA